MKILRTESNNVKQTNKVIIRFYDDQSGLFRVVALAYKPSPKSDTKIPTRIC